MELAARAESSPSLRRSSMRRSVVQVKANPELKSVVISGANALPQRSIEDAFRDQYGKTLNFSTFNAALSQLNSLYRQFASKCLQASSLL